MGALTSRQHAGVEEVDIPSNSVYRYPPKSGSYFANHFIMGGEKFDSTHPEGYLFGENSDLNFLGNRPVAFPYAAPPPQEPVKTLRSLINIRKDTLRLVKHKSMRVEEEQQQQNFRSRKQMVNVKDLVDPRNQNPELAEGKAETHTVYTVISPKGSGIGSIKYLWKWKWLK